MPLNKRKIRKILSALDPSLKPDLLVEQLKEDTTENLNELVKKVSIKFKELKDSLLNEFDARLKKLPNFSKEIGSLRSEFEVKLKELEKEDIGTIQTQMQDLVSNEIDDENLREDLEDKIEGIRTDFLRKLSHLGGGNANREIRVNSSVISTRYTDINFFPGSVLGIATANDDVAKRVNFTISGIPSSIASAAIAGNNTEIQYNNSGTFGTSSTLTWNRNTSILSAGNLTAAGAGGNISWGTYTPTASILANLDASPTISEAQYLRVGNSVNVSGRFTANPTITATATSFDLSFPVISDIGAIEDAAGVAFSGAIS